MTFFGQELYKRIECLSLQMLRLAKCCQLEDAQWTCSVCEKLAFDSRSFLLHKLHTLHTMLLCPC
jgi:hypothetical protein